MEWKKSSLYSLLRYCGMSSDSCQADEGPLQVWKSTSGPSLAHLWNKRIKAHIKENFSKPLWENTYRKASVGRPIN